jgi:hypothetical protein
MRVSSSPDRFTTSYTSPFYKMSARVSYRYRTDMTSESPEYYIDISRKARVVNSFCVCF